LETVSRAPFSGYNSTSANPVSHVVVPTFLSSAHYYLTYSLTHNNTEVDRTQLASTGPPIPPKCDHNDCDCWKGYPQSRFPNWTERQVRKSKIWDAIHDYRRDLECKIFRCDVDTNGYFTDAGSLDAEEGKDAETWRTILSEINRVSGPAI
jgi:hypothetical protein